ncbi:MAG: DUF2207 domain-containing protein [Firmicutes bacterium]|nr:DUF2207 domain-containing protein [Bacillota bacterium]
MIGSKSRKRSVRYSGLGLLVLLGFSFLLMAQSAAPVRADDRSYYFPRVLIEAVLYPDGSMSVVEERTFSFDGRFRGAWEYIYLKNNASIRDLLVSEKGEP